MKKTIALFAAVLSLACASAQEQKAAATGTMNEQPKGPKPEMMATRHSKHLQKLLGLSDDQTKKTYDALLTRFNEAHAIREKAGANADKKTLRAELKPVRQKFTATMNSILTPDQKKKWDEHRAQMKENRMKRNNANGNKPTDASNEPKKLSDDDDGMDD